MKLCPKFSFGVGDRFAHGASAQLEAFQQAARLGIELTPVWNKSNREHQIIGSEPADGRLVVDAAVATGGWDKPYLLDADHINLATVERFIAPCDFFTLDVAAEIGTAAPTEEIEDFVNAHPELSSETRIEGIAKPLSLGRHEVEKIARQFLAAVKAAGRIHKHIEERKDGDFVTEVSMDETENPQSPAELLVILIALADENVPVQTIAPKFSGRFNKGVDYVGDAKEFEREFSDDLAVIAHVVKHYRLPAGLKISVHSGSDKFSIYPAIRRCLATSGAGLHVKTAGTNWLEELIGLAEAGNDGLALVKDIYREALIHKAELCEPYATVIAIRDENLPTAQEVDGWSGEEFMKALQHNPSEPNYNPDLRQLLHVGFKIAAKMGTRYTDALKMHAAVIAPHVTSNLLERHIKPLFLQ